MAVFETERQESMAMSHQISLDELEDNRFARVPSPYLVIHLFFERRDSLELRRSFY